MEGALSIVSPRALRILVDYREHDTEVVDHLRNTEGIEIHFEHLRTGDFKVGEWLIERKTLHDFANSVIDGRLFSQSNRLARYGGAMVIEGASQDFDAISLDRRAVQGAMITLSMIYRIPVLRAVNAEETARLLVFAASQFFRLEASEPERHGRKPKRLKRLRLHVLQGLPGIGPRKAMALLERFGSVRAVFAATEDELRTVQGIDQVIALRIREVIGHCGPKVIG